MYKRSHPLIISNFLDAKMLAEVNVHYGDKIKKIDDDLKVLALKFYGECCDVYVDKELPISSICIIKDKKHVIIQYDYCLDKYEILQDKQGGKHKLSVRGTVNHIDLIDVQYYIDTKMWFNPSGFSRYVNFWYQPLSIETFSIKKC